MRGEAKARLEHCADSTFDKVGIGLYIVTRGRLSRVMAHRRTLLLRTRARRTRKPHAVVLRYFPDGDDMLGVAANAGLPRNPDWYHNLRADPDPSVLVEGRSVHMSVGECPAESRDAFWSLFVHHVRGDRFFALWLLVATAGLRRGDLAGLQLSDTDFPTRSVSTSTAGSRSARLGSERKTGLLPVTGHPLDTEPRRFNLTHNGFPGSRRSAAAQR